MNGAFSPFLHQKENFSFSVEEQKGGKSLPTKQRHPPYPPTTSPLDRDYEHKSLSFSASSVGTPAGSLGIAFILTGVQDGLWRKHSKLRVNFGSCEKHCDIESGHTPLNTCPQFYSPTNSQKKKKEKDARFLRRLAPSMRALSVPVTAMRFARQGECVLFPCVFDCFGGWGQSAAETLPSLLRPAGRNMAETPTHAMPPCHAAAFLRSRSRRCFCVAAAVWAVGLLVCVRVWVSGELVVVCGECVVCG